MNYCDVKFHWFQNFLPDLLIYCIGCLISGRYSTIQFKQHANMLNYRKIMQVVKEYCHIYWEIFKSFLSNVSV